MTDDSHSDAERAPVTAARPDSAFQVSGLDHVTLIGSNVEDTIAFYRDVLGMPLVLRQPNLDQPDVTHLFFDPGDGRLLTFFVHEDRDSNPGPQQPGVGAVHHLAFRIDAERMDEIKDALQAAGHRFSEFDRGAFHSLYTRDHNGLTIELAADKYAIPEDRRGEVLARAQAIRVESGDEYVDDEHVEAALDDLGIETDRRDVGEAPSGTGGL